jgi:hypothetical protein
MNELQRHGNKRRYLVHGKTSAADRMNVYLASGEAWG